MKRYVRVAAMIMLFFSLAGCAAGPAAEGSPTVQPEENNAPVLAVGDTVTVDGMCEFHVDYITMAEQPELFFKADTGKTFVEFCITYKNLSDYTIMASNTMVGKLVYSDQYEYDGIDMAEEEGGKSLSQGHTVQIEPSDTGRVHYFFTVPKEVQDGDRMVELDMSICGNDYRVIVREGEKGAVPGSGASGKISGAVADGEVVATDNSEFYVEYSEFTKDVKPPVPNAAYNHFVAGDGKIYIDFCIAYKNMSTKNIIAYKAVSAKLEQAEASSTVTEQSDRRTFEHSNLVQIIPLCTEYLHWVFQVPEEAASGNEKMTISFKIDGNSYTYSVK